MWYVFVEISSVNRKLYGSYVYREQMKDAFQRIYSNYSDSKSLSAKWKRAITLSSQGEEGWEKRVPDGYLLCLKTDKDGIFRKAIMIRKEWHTFADVIKLHNDNDVIYFNPGEKIKNALKVINGRIEELESGIASCKNATLTGWLRNPNDIKQIKLDAFKQLQRVAKNGSYDYSDIKVRAKELQKNKGVIFTSWPCFYISRSEAALKLLIENDGEALLQNTRPKLSNK